MTQIKHDQEQCLQLIQSGNALVKTICSPLGDDQSWDLLLPNLAESTYPKTTELTSTSLLPKHGRMHLFKPAKFVYNVMVGLIFDPALCQIVYVFENNVQSKQWLKDENAPIPPQISFQDLQAKLASTDQVLDNNEIMAELSKEALVGIFAPENNLFSRLNALNKQQLIHSVLNKKLPIFIISAEQGVLIYDEEQQRLDRKHAYERGADDPLKLLITDYKDDFEEVRPKLLQEIGPIHFIMDESAPAVLNSLILEYLGIAELASHVFRKIVLEPLYGLQNLLQKFLEELKNRDLRELEQLLGNRIDVNSMPQLMAEEHHTSNLLERAVFHFCWLFPKESEEVFYNYLKSIPTKNQHVVTAFLKYMPQFTLRYKFDLLISHEYEGNEYASMPWSPLLGALFTNKTMHASVVANYQPKQLSTLMGDLEQLSQVENGFFHEDTYFESNINANDLPRSKADILHQKKNLLYVLKDIHQQFYKFSYADKRLIEQKQLHKISKLTTKSDLENFYQKHRDSLAWTQHRHKLWDRLFGKTVTRCKQNILNALEKKLLEISAVDVLTAYETLNLHQEKIKVKGILIEKKAQMEQQKRPYCSLFKNASDIKTSIQAIESRLEQLEVITHPIELSLFKERVQLNKAEESDLILQHS